MSGRTYECKFRACCKCRPKVGEEIAKSLGKVCSKNHGGEGSLSCIAGCAKEQGEIVEENGGRIK